MIFVERPDGADLAVLETNTVKVPHGSDVVRDDDEFIRI
jgi:hypothetical protein